MKMLKYAAFLATALLALAACAPDGPDAPDTAADAAEPMMISAAAAGQDRAKLSRLAMGIFGIPPSEAVSEMNLITEAKTELGRRLYYDKRLSKNHDISCNSCHSLSDYGVDGEPTSKGHRDQRGDRNAPTVYNAAFHIAQFWDGRARDVEAQAKGPVLNPIEMAMPSEEAVVRTLKSIPGYAPFFRAAFPNDADPITYDHMAQAIGAFERRLVTPSRFDTFQSGELDALSDAEVEGLTLYHKHRVHQLPQSSDPRGYHIPESWRGAGIHDRGYGPLRHHWQRAGSPCFQGALAT